MSPKLPSGVGWTLEEQGSSQTEHSPRTSWHPLCVPTAKNKAQRIPWVNAYQSMNSCNFLREYNYFRINRSFKGR